MKFTYEQIQIILKNGQAIPEGSKFDLPPDINHWFELTYAQYLTIPRSVLQSMPMDWQYKFVELLYELDNTFDWRPKDGCYQVSLREEMEEWNEKTERMEFAWGKEIDDPLQDYRHPNREYIESLRTNQQQRIGDVRIDVTWLFGRNGFGWKAYRQFCQYDVLIGESTNVYESPEAAIADCRYAQRRQQP